MGEQEVKGYSQHERLEAIWKKPVKCSAKGEMSKGDSEGKREVFWKSFSFELQTV